MIGDNIHLKKKHERPAQDILKLISSSVFQSDSVYIIAIAGESGCGKSTLAVALSKVMDQQELNNVILHQDDYYHLPPASNHRARLDNINCVGPNEVNLDLMQSHVDIAIKGMSSSIHKPLVHYKENKISKEIIELNDIKVLIIEGTYTMLLDRVDLKVFMLRNFKDTYEARLARNRDLMVPFIEKVLEIEHKIISPMSHLGDILVGKDYRVERNIKN